MFTSLTWCGLRCFKIFGSTEISSFLVSGSKSNINCLQVSVGFGKTNIWLY